MAVQHEQETAGSPEAEHMTLEVGTYREDFYQSVPPPEAGGPTFVVHQEPGGRTRR